MTSQSDLIVMKFGGVSVSEPEQFSKIADIILKRLQGYRRIVVVVSAMGNTTNQLIELAKKVNPDPPKREYDMLVTAGERISISLLAMALAAKHQPAVSFTGSQSGIITCDRHSDARIINVKPARLLSVLDEGKIAIVAGFQGVSSFGEITTLGRGGSDITAVALAVALKAVKVEFFKDVSGIFSADPKEDKNAYLFSSLTYEKALELFPMGAKVLNKRCIELAKINSMPLHVQSYHCKIPSQKEGTLIADSRFDRPGIPVYENIP